MIVKASTNIIGIATAALTIRDFSNHVSREIYGLAITNLILVAFILCTMLLKNREHRNKRSVIVALLLIYNLIFNAMIIHNHTNGLVIDKTLYNMSIFIIGFNGLEFLSLIAK